LRTALVAWLFARSQGARFLVRIEDLDPQRSRAEFEQAQLDDLRVLGLDWDEPPVRQAERLPLYHGALDRLAEQRRLYPCFCTRAEIREAASAPHSPGAVAGLPPGAYPGTCLRLTERQRAERIRAGQPFALRVQAEREQIEFTDRLLGACAGVVDDFVVRRTDGVPAYQLAVVVDDAAQRIGEVVRGADLADSTPRQILLARWLGLPIPSYAHVALVLGSDGTRLAKRHGAVTLRARAEPPSATLALLAHTLGLALDRQRVTSASELLEEFDPERVPRSPVTLPPPA
jgi:glutamyl-tRNA synthetase